VRGCFNLLEQRVDLAVDARIVRRVCACSATQGSCNQPRGVHLNLHVRLGLATQSFIRHAQRIETQHAVPAVVALDRQWLLGIPTSQSHQV